MRKYETVIDVRYAETDKMGVVYHGSYLPWLEVARTSYLKELGFPYHELERRKCFLPVIELQVKYRKSMTYGQKARIATWFEKLKGIRIKINYIIKCEDEVILEASTTHTFIDENSRPVRPPDDLKEALEGL
jgi:acyl-CoA thioester hydrolase